MKGKAVKYYRNKCIACNLCVDMAPHLWGINNSDAKADLLGAQYHGAYVKRPLFADEQQDMATIASSCPGKAIFIE